MVERLFDEITAAEAEPGQSARRTESSADSQPNSLLVFERDSSWVYRLPAEGSVVIGRSSRSDLRLMHSSVSGIHAEIVVERGAVFLTDRGSRNGTRVNGRRVDGPVALSAGDLVSIASITLVLRSGEPPAAGNSPVTPAEFRRRAGEELDRAGRYNRSLTVASFAFERLPEDRSTVELVLERAVRAMDVTTWSRDDELLVLMPELTADTAFTIAGRLGSALASAARVARVGLASYPNDADGVDSLIAEARKKHLASPSDSSAALARPFRIFEVAGRQVIVADAAMLRVYAMVGHVAPSAMPVLIHGETGTGKELIAHAIHEWSPRASGPMIAVNCAALTESLVDSELFGHERGAFTGAVDARQGVFERGDGGTVFLDEVSELPLKAQAKLLRVLETKQVSRVGSAHEVEVDFRIVAATNRDLEQCVAEGQFRSDLFYRLSGATIWLPPLRERPQELPILAQIFLDAACQAEQRPLKSLSDDALAELHGHSWPGNIRELKNAMEYLASTVRGDVIEPRHLGRRIRPPEVTTPTTDVPSITAVTAEGAFRPLYEEIADLERNRMADALAMTDGNQTRAAELLSMPLRTFQTKVRQYGLAGEVRHRKPATRYVRHTPRTIAAQPDRSRAPSDSDDELDQ
ncbi:MAG TPA: sigma 54-interacting transcriptional regulator [Kofleriaceae bacterium]|nr:sigma 54-interacting transcriptional regulator [Kofleriaceae bacterium]